MRYKIDHIVKIEMKDSLVFFSCLCNCIDCLNSRYR